MAYVERSGGIVDLISRDLARYSLTARIISKSPVSLACRSAAFKSLGRRCGSRACNASSITLPGSLTGGSLRIEKPVDASAQTIPRVHVSRRHRGVIGDALVDSGILDSILDRAPQLRQTGVSWRLARRPKFLAHRRRDTGPQRCHLVERRDRRQILRRVEDRRLLAAHRPRRARDRLRNLTGSGSHRICRERQRAVRINRRPKLPFVRLRSIASRLQRRAQGGSLRLRRSSATDARRGRLRLS